MNIRCIRTLLLPAILLISASAAWSAEWRVARITGGGWVVSQTGASARMAAGMPVSPGSTDTG